MTKKNNATKTRLDTLVADRLNVSRARAQALIIEGKVRVGGERRVKAGQLTDAAATLEVALQAKFASRGGLKLERALLAFGWSVEGNSCLDVGASTGGFTDCLLQRGASRVTALDVGYGQLAWSLRNDKRVKPIERSNFRYADTGAIGGPFDFVSIDVSFISLRTLAPKLHEALKDGGRVVALIKPQFEAGRGANKRGVVRSAAAQTQAIQAVIEALEASGLVAQHLTYSPIAGPAGNIEFLLGAARSETVNRSHAAISSIDVQSVVDQARANIPQRDGQARHIR